MPFFSFLLIWVLGGTLLVFGETNEPVVRMLLPGFTVRELPLKLSNINNLRFAPDGRLTALGYDGRVHLLRDTDGDGLEDTDELFWDKPTISVPVGMCWSPEGLYVSSHGKVSRLHDTDGDGRADVEEIVARGWPGTDVGSGGVDATAVTRDAAGNLYFGLLVADYSNAYRLRKRKDLKPAEKEWLTARGDKGGDGEEEVSLYDIHSPRGTIQKWNAKTKKLETIATGIRVPYTLAFNRFGDLFVTDQEGETWMPHGNPLDELNHIVPGKNYGFPPVHEKWLPNLASESPVVAFGPQHQSSCGLVFNEPESKSKTNPGRGRFGPNWWQGDAFVAGESRGKIWRVRLVKTPNGYVGKEYLIARLSMLTTDVTISPSGDLYVCCHSGQPDWGTGPKGAGKIFKISYTDKTAPQPVTAWAAGPMEARVAFDKPLDAAVTNGLIGRTVEFGEHVRAADRFEVLKPPYQAVKQQEATPRGKLKIVGARLENKNQTLVLTTDPHPQAVTYALTIPGVKAPEKIGSGETVDVDYDLREGDPAWNGGKNHTKLLSNPFQTTTTYPNWVPTNRVVAGVTAYNADLSGGDWENGKGLYFGKQLQCSTCHRVRGVGGIIGPDLSNLVSRDTASVLRDIKDPNASINPDYVAYQVVLKSGDALTGFVRAQNEGTLRIIAADGTEKIIPRVEISELRVSSTSLMPSGLMDGLKENEVRDLLTFLRHEPPKHTKADLEKILGTTSPDSVAPPLRNLELVLVASKQDHGPEQHDYPAWQTNWTGFLATMENVKVTSAWEWPSPEQFRKADVLVFYFWNHGWTPSRLAEIDRFQARGGGIVLLHSACITDKEPEVLAERFGLAAQPKRTKYRHGPLELKFASNADDPIGRGFTVTHFLDESYWPLIGDTDKVTVLATAEEEGKPRPMLWTFQKGPGRVFGSIPGHYSSTWNDPVFRLMLLRGVAWTAGEPGARFEKRVRDWFGETDSARRP